MGTSETSPTSEQFPLGASAVHTAAAQEIATLKALTAAQAARIAILEEQFRLAAVKAFTPKSEKLSALAQMDLFNEAEAFAAKPDAETQAVEITVPAYARARGKRKPIDASLPRVRVVAKRASGTTSTTSRRERRPAPAAANLRASAR